MQDSPTKPRIGVSSCLLGAEVRFDGGHKRNRYVAGTLKEYFEFAAFCPEQAIGLPTPRKPIRLITPINETEIQAVDIRDYAIRYTAKLDDYARTVVAKIDKFSGYIVKKDSPSCGMERVKVYEKENTPPDRKGIGIFTARLMTERPELPVEEEGRLTDSRLRENFITRVFTMSRWQELVSQGMTKLGLIQFHTRHKFLLLAHHEATYRELGPLLTNLGTTDLNSIAMAYIKLLMTGLKHLANPGKHANVLMHMMGFVKDQMSADEKVELLDVIETHRVGLVPLIVPITLLKHFLRRYPNDYINGQYYLQPHPRGLMLRNSI